jgi:membrane protease YdiL (CAAX protease family)
MSGTAVGAFAALTVAALSLWIERTRNPAQLIRGWLTAASLSLVLAVAAGLVDHRGLLAVLGLAALATASNRAGHPLWRTAANVATLTLAAGMFLHAVPGFANPRVLSDVLLTPDAVPYTKYLNFDKGMAGLILLGLYVPDRVRQDEGWKQWKTLPLKIVALALVVMIAALASGYVRWAPKLPPWWPLWMWSMLLLTALPEEAAFRGVIQSAIAKRRGREAAPAAILLAGTAFGLAHLAGGPIYVLVATLAGIGYGWIYAETRSIGSAILAHAGLNTLHLLLFTYPALAAAV